MENGAIFSIDTPALLAGRRLSPELDVGLLFVMWRLGNSSAPRKNYLEQILKSARAAKALNPRLGIALATNVKLPREPALDIVHQLSPPTPAQRRRSTWFHRLRAIVESPFELTVALDASVTVCSGRLHAALQSEHRRDRFDFAVGFEATPLVRPGVARSPGDWDLPRRLEEVLPHNFAFAFRRGPGWARLLRAWMSRDGDDQQTLRKVLQAAAAARGSKPAANSVREQAVHLEQQLRQARPAYLAWTARRPSNALLRPLAGPSSTRGTPRSSATASRRCA